MSVVMKERYVTARGKEYELTLKKLWEHSTDKLAHVCLVFSTPLSQSLSQSQNVQIHMTLSSQWLAQLNPPIEIEQVPVEFVWRSAQLILEKQGAPSDTVKLLFTDKGLTLESLGKVERNELLVSWGGVANPSMAMSVAWLEKALSDAREQSKRVGFH